MQAEHAGWRLDRFLAATLPQLSRSRLQQLIAEGAVALAGAKIGDANHRVKPGERYQVLVPPPIPAEPQPEAIPLVIVYEDSDLLVVDKPAGLVVHPAAGNPDGTLVNALLAHCADLAGIGGVARPGIVHRLDKDTSGLLVVAKNERAMRSLAKQFAAHAVERAYNAVVWGAPRAGDGMVEGNLARSPFDRKRMAVMRDSGKPARTRYRLLERFGPVGGRPRLCLAGRMPAGDRAHASNSRAPGAYRPSADRRFHLWPRAKAAARAHAGAGARL